MLLQQSEENQEKKHNNTNFSLDEQSVMGVYVKNIIQKLNVELKNTKTLSMYSELKTFWINPPNSFLFRCKSNSASPDNDYIRPVFVWAPHLFFLNNKIPCPKCKGKMELMGWPSNPKARFVIDLFENFYILSYNYKCCFGTRLGSSDEVLQILPPQLSSQFPAISTHKGTIAKKLVKLLSPCFNSGLGPEAFSSMLWELQTQSYDEKYVNWQYHVLKIFTTESVCPPNPNYAQFSSFLDTSGYNAHIPSPSFLTDIFNDAINIISPDIEKKMGMYEAEILRQDLSFKVR